MGFFQFTAELKSGMIRRYPHCWRTKSPIIYRATKQWFVDLGRGYVTDYGSNAGSVMEKAIRQLDSVDFVPENQKDRLKLMVSSRREWCVSRQRKWGVPIALFLKDGELVLDREVTNFIHTKGQKEGFDGWWDEPNEAWLPTSWHDRADQLVRITDTLDVWFDSGMSWLELFYSKETIPPYDLYIEGNDQHRGWFQSSLLLGVGVHETAPYKKVVTHGFVVDEKGEKMAKSKGNVISPNTLIEQHGPEVVRTWVASSDYHKDIRVSEESLRRASEDFRKVRNTLRFIVANMDETAKYQDVDLYPVDVWIIHQMGDVQRQVVAAFDNMEFHRAAHLINEFIRGDLSGIWMNAVKDSLYCDSLDDPKRVSHQIALREAFCTLCRLCSTIWTCTVNEALQNAPEWLTSGQDVFDWEPPGLLSVQGGYDADVWRKRRVALVGFHEEFDRIKRETDYKDKLQLVVCHDEKIWDGEEDWYGVSSVSNICCCDDKIGEFKVDGVVYFIVPSQLNKCDRCWKYLCHEGEKCQRCNKVLEKA